MATHRELAELFKIDLLKWKRWSREFIPPDPAAGRQAGIARDLTPSEALLVFLGGRLVEWHRLRIEETRNVLRQLVPWMKTHGFLPVEHYGEAKDAVKKWEIQIWRLPNGHYLKCKGLLLPWKVIQRETTGGLVGREEYVVEHLGPAEKPPERPDPIASLQLTENIEWFFATMRAVGLL